MTRKEYIEEFKRNGVTITRNLILQKEYTGDAMKWAEAWIARQQIPWLGLTIGLVGTVIGLVGWLFPH
jgi:hypothetical protein